MSAEFLESIGLAKIGDLPKEAIPIVRDNIELFLRGGGHYTLEDWKKMTPQVRELFASVGDKLRRLEVFMLSMALASEENAASVLTPIDGGRRYMDIVLERKLDEIIEKNRFSWEK